MGILIAINPVRPPPDLLAAEGDYYVYESGTMIVRTHNQWAGVDQDILARSLDLTPRTTDPAYGVF